MKFDENHYKKNWRLCVAFRSVRQQHAASKSAFLISTPSSRIRRHQSEIRQKYCLEALSDGSDECQHWYKIKQICRYEVSNSVIYCKVKRNMTTTIKPSSSPKAFLWLWWQTNPLIPHPHLILDFLMQWPAFF